MPVDFIEDHLMTFGHFGSNISLEMFVELIMKQKWQLSFYGVFFNESSFDAVESLYDKQSFQFCIPNTFEVFKHFKFSEV